MITAKDRNPIAGILDATPYSPDQTAGAPEMIPDLAAARARLTALAARLEAAKPTTASA